MRSWQRVLIAGIVLLVAGAVARVVSPDGSHGSVATAGAIAAVIALGIGGSVIASALVAWLVTNQVFGIDVGEAVEALRGVSALTRRNQVLNISLDLQGDEVRATAEHRFDLVGSSRFPRKLPFRLYTDIARWGSGGGFFSLEVDGAELRGQALADCVRNVEGKVQFQETYTFRRGKPVPFVVSTFAQFRRSDRLIWTVEHISSDFSVSILDRRGIEGGHVGVKINHHRARDIVANMQPRETLNGEVLEFTCLGEVLPYQGFELEWTDPRDVRR